MMDRAVAPEQEQLEAAAPAEGAATQTSAPEPSVANLPNAITLAGYAASVGWLAGGPPWLAILGMVADEVDGRVARATGTASEFGSLLDWGVDLTLTGLAADRAGMLWLLPFVTPIQVQMRNEGSRPPIGSARALFTAAALLRGDKTPPVAGRQLEHLDDGALEQLEELVKDLRSRRRAGRKGPR
jgi:hypothetical protein